MASLSLRVPPGHSGRMWLLRRLEVASRGVGLLERKQRVLAAAERDLRNELAEAERNWREAGEQAKVWLGRAALVDGANRVRRLAAYVPETLTVDLTDHNVMGVRCPRVDTVEPPEDVDLSGLGASSALLEAAIAYSRAAEAGVRYAAGRAAHERVSAELQRVAHRRRAIERRWIPSHQAALSKVELSLEEAEREHATRVRWLIEHPSTGADHRPPLPGGAVGAKTHHDHSSLRSQNSSQR